MCYCLFHACNRMRERAEAHHRGRVLSRWTEQTDVEQKPPRPYWTNSAASEGVSWCLWSVPNDDAPPSVPKDDAPGQRECAGEIISPRTRAHANDSSDDSIFLPPPHTLRGRLADGEDVSEVGPYDPQGLRRSQLATFPQHSTPNDWERGGEKGTDNPRGYPTSPTSMSRTREESSTAGAYNFLCVCPFVPLSSGVCLSMPPSCISVVDCLLEVDRREYPFLP
jgi:hypothetical protein